MYPPGIAGCQLAFFANRSSDLRYRDSNRAEELGNKQQTQFDTCWRVMDSDPFAISCDLKLHRGRLHRGQGPTAIEFSVKVTRRKLLLLLAAPGSAEPEVSFLDLTSHGSNGL